MNDMESRFLFCYHFPVITFLLSNRDNLITESGFSTPLLRAVQLNLAVQSNMKNNKKNRAGFEAQYDPRPVGEILHDFFENSNEPLAVAFRHRKAYANTEPCVDLKLLTQKPGRMPEGECLIGTIAHDSENHFTFCEAVPETKSRKHNPCIYKGYAINVHRKDDGTIYPTFRQPQYTKYYTFMDFCREAAEELLMMAGLVEEEMSE